MKFPANEPPLTPTLPFQAPFRTHARINMGRLLTHASVEFSFENTNHRSWLGERVHSCSIV